MLELLDTGRMAHKYGKWRGAIAIASGAPFFVIALVIPFILDVLPNAPRSPVLMWVCFGLIGLACALWIYGFYLLYRDWEHKDHLQVARRYKTRGW